MRLHRHRSVPRRPGLDPRPRPGGHRGCSSASTCHKHRHAAALLDARGGLIDTLLFANSPEGYRAADRAGSSSTTPRRRSSASRTRPGSAGPLATALDRRPGFEVLNVPAWRTHRDRRRLGPGKTDPGDAHAIAQVVLRVRRRARPALEPELVRALGLLELQRHRLVRDRTQAIQRLRSTWQQVDPVAEARVVALRPPARAAQAQADRLRRRPGRHRSPPPSSATSPATSTRSTSASPTSTARSPRCSKSTATRSPTCTAPATRSPPPDRPRRRRAPLPRRRRLRALLRRRTDPLRLRPDLRPPPPPPRRQPPTQRRPLPDRDRPGTPPPTRPAPSSPARSPKARPRAKPAAPSSATSPTSSTAASSPGRKRTPA